MPTPPLVMFTAIHLTAVITVKCDDAPLLSMKLWRQESLSLLPVCTCVYLLHFCTCKPFIQTALLGTAGGNHTPQITHTHWTDCNYLSTAFLVAMDTKGGSVSCG